MQLIVNLRDMNQSEVNRLISTIRTLQGVTSVSQNGMVKEILTGKTPMIDEKGPRPLFG